jgi:hypothetical protein
MIERALRRTAFLVSIFAVFALLPVRCLAAPQDDNVTLTGLVTCSRCVGSPAHSAAFTHLTWAVHEINHGDGFILVVSGKTYHLAGDRELLRPYIADQATVQGRLNGDTIEVQSMSSRKYATPFFPAE